MIFRNFKYIFVFYRNFRSFLNNILGRWAEPLITVFLTEVLKEGFCNNWTKTLKKLQILSLGMLN